MRTAYLFPGQGSQYPGMGQDLYETFPAARAVFDQADGILGFDLTECCFSQHVPRDHELWALTKTDICQAAIFTHSIAVVRVLGRTPEVVAGHSVGEYSALVAAGVLSFADGLRTVRLRSQLMAQAGKNRPGTMSAILGLDHEAVIAVCRQASSGPQDVEPANFNAPGQTVISGDAEAVKAAGDLARARGARRVVPLKVSGAFHSSLMQEVHGQFALHVADLEISKPVCPVYLNTTGTVAASPRDIRESMLQQLTSAVHWMNLLNAMSADGVSQYMELGPGRILSRLVRRTLGRKTRVVSISSASDVARWQMDEAA